MTELGVEYGAKFTLTGPDGTKVVFNDSTDPNYVGILSMESSGLDSADVREDAAEAIEADGGIHGNFFYGRRPVVLQGTIIASSAAQRNERAGKLLRATNAMRADAVLKWTPVGGAEVELKLRRQQPARITGGFVKSFQIAMVSADARILSTASHASSVTSLASGPTATKNASTSYVFGEKSGEGGNWANIGNIFTSNNAYATVSGFEGESQWLVASGFGFSIPTTATVTKIAVFIERKGSNIFDSRLRLFPEKEKSEGETINVDGPVWPASDTVREYIGTLGSFPNWEAPGVTATKVNGANFGVGLKVIVGPEFAAMYSGSVDLIQMKVYYENAPMELTINNSIGNTAAYPVVKLTGPGNIWTLKNATTGQTMVIEANLAAGHVMEINFKNHTITDNGVNIYGKLNFTSSNWWLLEPGSNKITCAVSELATTSTKMEVEYRDTWL